MSFLAGVNKHINLGNLPSDPAKVVSILASIVERYPVPIWIYNSELTIVYDNEISWDFGSGNSIVGLSVSNFSPNFERILRTELTQCAITGKSRTRAEWMDSPVLGHVFIKFNFMPLPHGMVAVSLYDQTENKQVEERLLKSEERVRFFADILERAAIPFAAAHPDSRLITFNRAFEQLTGYSEAELQQKSWNQHLTHPKWHEHETRMLNKLFDSKLPQRYEVDYQRKDTSIVPVEITVQMVALESGEPKYIFAFITDIAERKQIQNKLLHDQREESITTLAGGIAHDFNNILTGIMGAVSLIQELTADDSSIAEWSDIIATAAARMSDMTTKLLTYSRGGKVETKALDVQTLIRDALKMAKSSLPSNVRIQIDLAGELAMVMGNAGQLNQVLLNLIINAGEAMQARGGVLCIRAWNEIREQEWTCVHQTKHSIGRYIHIEASDTGCGMEQRVLSRIFEPFYSTKTGARGLGLAASLNIIKDMGGCLSAESKPGRGTTFHLLAPQATVAPLAPVVRASDDENVLRTILLIEDNDIVRRTMKAVLLDVGHNVIVADSGPIGLDQYRMRYDSIDLVILDLHMPIMSGAEVLQHMQQVNPYVKVLVCSAQMKDDALRDINTDRIAGYLQKPYRADQLARAVREALKANISE